MEGVEYWRCVKRSNGYCTGRIHVLAEWRQLNEIRYKLGKIANAAHNHPADPEKQSIRDAIEKLKNLAGMENPLITREAVDQSRATINMAARANAPSTSAMSRTYQRWVGTAEVSEIGNGSKVGTRKSEIKIFFGNRKSKEKTPEIG
uniref:Uncharacterized protein n=1 Tax=Meloidogyne enterolobii TaxID=390850 RepID=A0A6V7W307_MELEN|nr:unnamed protein product [Meloidogyne enterolobii]